jgi:acetylornithine deacetylase/succinyl-diaminopimelate desuccinylase-like protein
VSTGFVDELLAFASIPAPTFAEEPRLAWLERRLAGEPGELARDRVGNLIWRFGPGATQLLLLAHVDTVFPADTELAFARRGGQVTGPGIGDNAAAVVAVVRAVADVLARGIDRAGAVAFTVAEEGLGDLRGAHEACEQLRPSVAIAVEGHGLEQVLVDAVGSRRYRVRVTGPGGHSWADRGTPSAVHAVLHLGMGLNECDTPEGPVNIGLVSGGQSVNSIAAEAELLVEQRSLDEQTLERFAAHVRRLTLPPPLRLAVDEVGNRPAGRLDRGNPLLAQIRGLRAALELPDDLGAGSTDANAALARGIPALTLGVARGGRMHTADEWLDEGSLALGLQQLTGVLDLYLRA